MKSLFHYKKKIQAFLLPLAFFVSVFALAFIVPLGAETAHANAHEPAQRGVFQFLLDKLFKVGDWSIGLLFSGIMQAIFTLSGYLVKLGGFLLEISIENALRPDNYVVEIVQKGWGVIRNVANLTFIFILLYIAIRTILRLEKDTKQLLVNVVIVALLVNFSLFFTQIVIDAGNILATLFFNNITSSILVGGNQAGIGTILMEALKPQSLFAENAFKGLSNTSTGFAYLLGTVALLFTAFSFLAVAIMFILRTAALIVLIILSPLAFAAYVLDDFRKYFTDWWHMLLSQSFFAPAYLLVLYVVLLVVTHERFTRISENTSLAEGINATIGSSVTSAVSTVPSSSAFTVFFTYTLIIFLLNAALIVAKKLGGTVAALGVKYAGTALGLATGLAGSLGRRTIGRGLAGLAQSEGFKEATSKTGLVGRLAMQGATAGGKASFDVRGGKVGQLLSAGASQVGTDLGSAGGKGGYKAIEEAKIKRAGEFANAVKGAREDPNDALLTSQDNDRLQELSKKISIYKQAGGEANERRAQEAGEEIKNINAEIASRPKIRAQERETERVTKVLKNETGGVRGFLMNELTRKKMADAIRKKGRTEAEQVMDLLQKSYDKKAKEGGGELEIKLNVKGTDSSINQNKAKADEKSGH